MSRTGVLPPSTDILTGITTWENMKRRCYCPPTKWSGESFKTPASSVNILFGLPCIFFWFNASTEADVKCFRVDKKYKLQILNLLIAIHFTWKFQISWILTTLLIFDKEHGPQKRRLCLSLLHQRKLSSFLAAKLFPFWKLCLKLCLVWSVWRAERRLRVLLGTNSYQSQ